MLDIKKLKKIEADFLQRYPGGFDDPEIIKVGKKHRMDKMVELAQHSFRKRAFNDVPTTVENMVKVVSRSSMVSMFEKPKFRDFVLRLDNHEQAFLVNALKQMLHGKQQAGFEAMVEILKIEKLAKWSLVTIIPAYYAPSKEVFVKPTTAKNVLRHFAIEDPVYKPTPSWDFYRKYRDLINNAKQHLDPSLSPSNAAFSGVLMMSVSP